MRLPLLAHLQDSRTCGIDSICVDDSTIPLSASMKDLGVIIDSDLNLEKYIV